MWIRSHLRSSPFHCYRAPLFLLGTFLLAYPLGVHAAESQTSLPSSTRVGTELRLGFAPYTSYLSRTGPTYPSMNLSGGARFSYYLKPSLGLFTGVDTTTRGYELLSGKVASPVFADIPFGIEFKHLGGFGSDNALNIFRIGGFLAIPTGSLVDYGGVEAGQGKLTGGALLEGVVLFPIWNRFYVGPNMGMKYGIRSPFTANPGYSSVEKVMSFLDFYTGISTSYLF